MRSTDQDVCSLRLVLPAIFDMDSPETQTPQEQLIRHNDWQTQESSERAKGLFVIETTAVILQRQPKGHQLREKRLRHGTQKSKRIRNGNKVQPTTIALNISYLVHGAGLSKGLDTFVKRLFCLPYCSPVPVMQT